jgi:hypothetical protein
MVQPSERAVFCRFGRQCASLSLPIASAVPWLPTIGVALEFENAPALYLKLDFVAGLSILPCILRLAALFSFHPVRSFIFPSACKP